MPESIKSSEFLSYGTRMSREFDSMKNSHLTNFERRPRKLVKLSFRELRHSNLSDLTIFAKSSILDN